MKGMRLLMAVLLLSVAFAMPPWAGGGHGGAVSATGPTGELSEEEKAALEYMIQEEKLARDVYLTLYEKWNASTFSNIARSEQNHMDAVAALMDLYGVENPLPSDEVGIYRDEAFADLYHQLVDQGSASLADAYKVGALIEELDIKDLQERLAETTNPDVERVFSNLMKGSRNHLRAFVGQLRAMGEDYTPQYISQEEFEAIVGSEYETGSVDRWGNIRGQAPAQQGGQQMGPQHPHTMGPSMGPAVDEVARAKGWRVMEVKQEGNRFRVKAVKTFRLFGILPIEGQVEAVVDETGNVVEVKKPWWAFLALE